APSRPLVPARTLRPARLSACREGGRRGSRAQRLQPRDLARDGEPHHSHHVGIVLIGYYTSRVEGIAQGVPVMNVEGRAGRPETVPACRPLQSWLGTAYKGGPDALVLDRQVQALTGRQLDSLRGAYRLNEITVR